MPRRRTADKPRSHLTPIDAAAVPPLTPTATGFKLGAHGRNGAREGRTRRGKEGRETNSLSFCLENNRQIIHWRMRGERDPKVQSGLDLGA